MLQGGSDVEIPPRSAGMPTSLNMSQAENIQPSLQTIEKEITLHRSLNAHDSVLHKSLLMVVALPLMSTPSMGRTGILMAHSTITLGIIVSIQVSRSISF